MQRRLLALTRRFYPKVDSLTPLARVSGVGDVLGTLYALPLALIGLVWLLRETDVEVFRQAQHQPTLLLIFLLLYLCARLGFFIISEIRSGVFIDFDGSLEPIITFSAVLLFGVSVLWLNIFWILLFTLRNIQRARPDTSTWNIARNATLDICHHTLVGLLSFLFYERSGGQHPIPALDLPSVTLAAYAMLLWLGLFILMYLPLVVYWSRSIRGLRGNRVMLLFIFLMSWQVLLLPFGILGAGLHSEFGLRGYLFFTLGLVMAASLAHQLSKAVENSRQRTAELERLEHLGKAILDAPADASNLPDLLGRYVSNLFPQRRMEIRLFPELSLLRQLEDSPPAMWEWLQANPSTHFFARHQALPWNHGSAESNIILIPISDAEKPQETMGGICIMGEAPVNRQDVRAGASVIPAAQTLAAQVAAAVQRARMYHQALSNQRMRQEVALAGQIQATFLPQHLPEIKGWQIAALLEPARQTAGDFYDIIELPDGRLGILIADVADKGVGAALFMALSRTLLRTYATEYVTWPEIVLQAANHRILVDTKSNVFVTVFYGILDTRRGILTYCNAGHNPALLLRKRKAAPLTLLQRTGVPLGLFEDYRWEAASIDIKPGDSLVLYTDGITEAQNRSGEFFGEERLRQMLLRLRGRSARSVLGHITREVYHFLRGRALLDDLTLLVITRNG